MRTEREIGTLLYALPIIILVLGALLGLSLWVITSSGTAEPGEQSQEIVDIETGPLPPLGNEDAPVQIVMFGDYQCPFCTQFFAETEQRLRATFVREGKATFWWRDFAVLGPDSVQAARAARCAHEQGAFWHYHDLLFLARGSADSLVFTDGALELVAAQAGLDRERFNECLASGRYGDEVAADQREGREKGVQGVPTVFINGRKLVGAQPYAVFESIINEELEK